MSFGAFYKIEDDVSAVFKGKRTKSEWYDALGEINIDGAESLEVGESISAWVLAFKAQGVPLNLLFQGELGVVSNENNDPDVVFVGKEMLASIVKEIEDKSEYYFEKLLEGVNCSSDFWLFKPMFHFLKSAVTNNQAIVILWGG